MALLIPINTLSKSETFGGLTYQVKGELVPMLQIELELKPIYFLQHSLVWKDPQVQVSPKILKEEFNRIVGNKPSFMVQAKGIGSIALSCDAPGKIFTIPLKAFESFDVKDNQFVAASDNVEYSFTKLQKVSDFFVGAKATYIDNFLCKQGEGIVWLYGKGNVFEFNLKEGEQIDLEHSRWIYKNKSVKMEISEDNHLILNRFTGPGRVGIQTLESFNA